MKVLIIGRGRVGSGLRRTLSRHAEIEVSSAGRKISASAVRAADVLVLAVPDDAIEEVAETIAPHLKAKAKVLHCAGARSVDELRACAARGAAVGVMHPLVSFPSKRSHPSLRGASFTISGDRSAIAASRRIAAACGARTVVANTDDPAYHAAAALAANGAAALAFASVSLLERLGFDKRAAEQAIGGLLGSVGENVQDLGVPEALTGPVARGDVSTVARHRSGVRRLSREALSTYDALIPVIVRCARAVGLSKAKAAKILGEIER
jgi:predicted short-subunit dehydrogenase-like oxidoreductase (DUF2520 family)